MRMKSGSVVGRSSQKSQSRRICAIASVVCGSATRARSSHTSMHSMQPLQVYGLTVIANSPPLPFCFFRGCSSTAW